MARVAVRVAAVISRHPPRPDRQIYITTNQPGQHQPTDHSPINQSLCLSHLSVNHHLQSPPNKTSRRYSIYIFCYQAPGSGPTSHSLIIINIISLSLARALISLYSSKGSLASYFSLALVISLANNHSQAQKSSQIIREKKTTIQISKSLFLFLRVD